MAREKDTWAQFLKQLLYYHTVKVVQIRSWKLGLLYYFIMTLIMFYVGFYAIYWNKGYQGTAELVGNTAIKVKGAAYIKNGDAIDVWDAENVVYPPVEPDALFVTTNYKQTKFQKRSTCPGNIPCKKDPDCPPFGGETDNGVSTGTCNPTTSTCNIYAWCQLESPEDPENYLINVGNFSVFIRVTVKFPKYGITRTNANGTANGTLSNGYNQFWVHQMLEAANTQFDSVKKYGGAFAVVINWQCDFDRSPDHCQPEFKFIRIDDPNSERISKGYNFRYAHYYYLSDGGEPVENRDLYKALGLRFVFLVSGEGRKFDVVPLIINIGSGLALISIATVISDFITLFILPDRLFYNKVKYESVDTIQQKKLKKQQQQAKKETDAYGTMEQDEELQKEDEPLLDSISFR